MNYSAKKDVIEIVHTAGPAVHGPGYLLLEILREFGESKELAWRLLVRNINASYRQTYFGYLWAVLPSLAIAFVFVFLRSFNVIDTQTVEQSYTVYVVAGVFFWHSFTESIASPLKMLNESASYLGKVNFPKTALIMAGLGEVIFNSTIRWALLILIITLVGTEYGRYAFLAPLGFLSLIIFGFAIGIVIAPFGMLFRDVEKGIAIITYLWFFLTPVFYQFPATLSKFYLYINPVSPLLITARELLINDQPGYLEAYFLYTGLAVFMLIPGLLVYKLSMPYIIERIEA